MNSHDLTDVLNERRSIIKFKGVLLREGSDSEAELMINVTLCKAFNEDDEAEDYSRTLEDSIFEYLDDLDCNLYLEHLANDIIQVRSEHITLDQNGILLLEKIYGILTDACCKDACISIGVHADT